MFQGDLVLDLIIEMITDDGGGRKRIFIELLVYKKILHPVFSST